MRMDVAKLSQIKFAEAVGVTEQVIQNLEQGITSCANMRYWRLLKIAEGLNETPETLVKKVKGV